MPAEPELFVSSQALFDTLGTTTGPIFQMNRVDEGNCTEPAAVRFASENGIALADQNASTVSVISQQQVGPYDTVVLKAESEEGLITYLQDNGYDLPSQLSEVLAPYIAFDAHFVALKLAKDQDAGDITPLGMTYAGTSAVIPIQLTSIAAAPDMRLEVYVFADRRAVPRSYLHVEVNHAAIDWWTGGSNYADAISQAANEAGGQAFATDYFGPSETFRVDYAFQRQPLRDAEDFEAWINQLFRMNVPMGEAVAGVVVDHVVILDDIDPVSFVQCVQCWAYDASGFDPVAATQDLDVRVLTPLEDTEALFHQPLMTRMTSSLDAAEMTVDPVFVLNADMSGEADFVPQLRSADLVYECGANRRSEKSRRRLELEDGRSILLPSEQWFRNEGTSEFEYIQDLGATKAQVIEQMGESGQPEVIVDFTGDLSRLTDEHNDRVRALLGCGCNAGSPAPAGGAALLLVLMGLARRRR